MPVTDSEPQLSDLPPNSDERTIKNCVLWPGQKRLLQDKTHADLVLSAGVGYGKTRLGPRWHYSRIVLNPNSPRSAVCAPNYRLAKFVNLNYYRRFLTEELELIENHDFTVNLSDLFIRITRTGQEIHFISSENYKSVVAWEFSHVWIDEPGHMSDEFFYYITERVRCPRASVLQKLFTGIPQGEYTEYYRKFAVGEFQSEGEYFDHYPRYRLSDQTLIMHAATSENKTLPATYIDQLKSAYGFNQNLWLAHFYGLFVPITKNQVYDFNRAKHIMTCKPDPKNPVLHLAFDFNPGQVMWVALQESEGLIKAVAESKPNNRTTDEACVDFRRQIDPDLFDRTKILVYGDSSGYHRSTRGYGHDYEIIDRLLRPYYNNYALKARHYNPAVTDRIMAVNRMLNDNPMTGEKSRLRVDSSLTKLIESLTATAYDGRGGIAKPGTKDTWTHASDALGYCIIELCQGMDTKNKRVEFHY